MNRNDQKRPALEALSDAGRSVLRVFAEASGDALSLGRLAISSKISTAEIEALLRGELQWWIESSILDDMELRCDIQALSSLVKPLPPPVSAMAERLVVHVDKQTSPSIEPYPWQKRAFASWQEAGYRGIVEAVTGTGKTHLGVMAVEEARRSAKQIYPLIVVPTVPVMEQWVQRLQNAFPEGRVGRIGNGHLDDFSTPGTVAIVGVINSLVQNKARNLNELFGFTIGTSAETLLVADECHRYIDGPVFSRLRQFLFDRTLGLSATIGDYEIDGIGRIIFEYGFKEAHAEGLVPSFDMLNCTVQLTSMERQKYLDLDKRCRDARLKVCDCYDHLNPNDSRFYERLKQLMGKMGSGNEPLIERLFRLFFKRAEVGYLAQRKMELAEELIFQLVEHQRKKVIVFFERIDSAIDVEQGVEFQVQCVDRVKQGKMKSAGFPTWVYHSQMRAHARKNTLGAFRSSGPGVLFACRCLDEGIDLPDVDAAILVSSTQSTRQRIQRIGRILRRGNGEKKPVVVTIIAAGTRDEAVTDSDRKIFDGVARIKNTDGTKACIAALASLAEAT